MPTKTGREYRAMNLLLPETDKRLDSDFYVCGLATTFNQPYLLYEWDGDKYYEVVDRHAIDGADLSDVIMQYDHGGRVFARNKMGGGKPPTLIVEPQDRGFFVAADLSMSEAAKQMYLEITSGLVHQMSWAFTVIEDSYDRATKTRTILKVGKVYDVSAVSIPANSNTEISARSYLDGVIEAEKRETQERLKLAQAKYFYFYGGKQ
ncbi:MAG: HK97 family phage prohead protease [Christensenella sp.]|nr:HK97 family phage prohead protease [Christensenella sp.]